eukprot:TRINITY_DN2736_c0_g1_i1.p1 TRINITY_DN2736_c0_g1~~TRINITY_DN2736_c0_g1_i1.p1  ORF type:complete len:725 (+),score=210.00 TRINITY_DN2736_c0_g1_i1:40-2214(+)
MSGEQPPVDLEPAPADAAPPASLAPVDVADEKKEENPAAENTPAASPNKDGPPAGDDDPTSMRRRYSDPHAKTSFAARLNFWQQVAEKPPTPAAAKNNNTKEQKDGKEDEKAAPTPKRAGRSVPAQSRRTSAANEVAAANASAKAALSVPTSPTLQVPAGLPSVKDRMKQFSHPPTQEYISRAKKAAPKAPKSLLRLSQIQRAVEKGSAIAPEASSSVDSAFGKPIPEDTVVEYKRVELEPFSPVPPTPTDDLPEPSPVARTHEVPHVEVKVQPPTDTTQEDGVKKPNLEVDVQFNDTIKEFGISSPSPLSPSIAQAARKLEGIEEMVGHMYDAVDRADEDEPKFSGTGKLEEMKISEPPTPAELQADLQKFEMKRALVREEIISTEKTYIASLKILIEKFAHPLKANDKCGVTQEQAARIFSNVEIISHFHDKLYEELQRPEVNVGDIFQKYADFLKMYTQYLNGYETSMTVINSLGSSKQFKSFLESRRQDPEVTLDLMSYLILPVQRIPRYELLLREFLKNTPEGHPEREVLAGAFEKVQSIAQHINESKRRVENMSKVLAIQNKIEGNMDVPLLAPHRRLIKEGHVEVGRSGLLGHTFRKRVIFLFNDSFLTTAEDFAFKDWILIESESFKVTALEAHGRYGFEVNHKDHNEKYFCVSEAEREEWIALLNATREAYAEVVNAAKERKLDPRTSSDAPAPESVVKTRGLVQRSPSVHSIKS